MATMAAILKIYFSLLLLNRKASWLETWLEASGWLFDQKNLNHSIRKSMMATVATILKIITKTHLYNFDPLKPHFYIVKLGFTGVYIIFLISAQNINCGYLLELPRQDSSDEYPQSMFWVEIWKISEFFIWKFSVFGGEIFHMFEYRCVFIMLFFASPPKLKGQLTWNLVESIMVICRSKIAKIVPVGNPSWPRCWPSWKSIFQFFSWTKKPIDLKLGRKHHDYL